MSADRLVDLLRSFPLIPSVQADADSLLDNPDSLFRMADVSIEAGARVVRLGDVDVIREAKLDPRVYVIGLLKRRSDESPVYITPTPAEVDELIGSGCDAIGMDGTARPRPGGATLRELIERAHAKGVAVVADCDTLDTCRHARSHGADVISTTLSGYTEVSPIGDGSPDLELVRAAAAELDLPVLAEGRYTEPWQAAAALRAGAVGVVVGAALNDPARNVARFAAALGGPKVPVCAVDLGSTWLRFAAFDGEGNRGDVERTETPATGAGRLAWIRERLAASGAQRIGVASAGVIDPSTGCVVEAKDSLPDHVGVEFSSRTLGVPTLALNDGLVTAWGHACLPAIAGRRVLTLALGTGLGCGMVAEHRLQPWAGGAYPRLNDLPAREGGTLEELLCARDAASERSALEQALEIAHALYAPEAVVLAGAVGLRLAAEVSGVVESPFGEHAGLHGAAALALFPPHGLAAR